MKRCLVFLAFFLVTVPLSAANLLTNGSFDSDLVGWTRTDSANWTGLDVNGSASSGSARDVYTGPNDDATLSSVLWQTVSLGTWYPDAKLRPSFRWLVTASGTAPSTADPTAIIFFRDSVGSQIGNSHYVNDARPLVTNSWRKSQSSDMPIPAGAVSVEMRITMPKYTNYAVHFDDASLEIVYGTCVENATTMCLSQGRFRVRATWATSDGSHGDGQAVRLTNDTGYFWFFNKDNVEVVIKVLNACTLGNYWVFASGLTDVNVELTVSDALKATTKKYTNPLKTPFAPVQDTSAFATCP